MGKGAVVESPMDSGGVWHGSQYIPQMLHSAWEVKRVLQRPVLKQSMALQNITAIYRLYALINTIVSKTGTTLLRINNEIYTVHQRILVTLI